MSTDFKIEPPWQEEGGRVNIPSRYTVVAELPCITWGWELDRYYWILKDQNGALVLGGSDHGRFCVANTDSLREQISTLSGYIEATKSALQLLESSDGELRP
jgi:hypothetical protein